jgi:hypothetical protein
MAVPDPDPRELLAEVLTELQTTPLVSLVTAPHQLIAAAAIARAVDVAGDMAALASPRSSLSSMALREVLECCVNALWALKHPDDEGRFVAVDRLARRKMQPTTGMSVAEWDERVAELEADYEDIVGDAKVLPDFQSRVDAVADLLPSPDEVRHAKLMYRFVSNFRMHAGFGVLVEYIGEQNGTPTIVATPALSNVEDELLLAVALVGMTLERFRSMAGGRPAS